MRAILLALALAGCAAEPPSVTVDLYQTRSDTPLDRIEMQVRNDGAGPLTVDSARLVSTGLTQFPVWEQPVEVSPGVAVDLQVQLPPATCGASADAYVVLTIGGRELTLPASDRLGQFAAYQESDCFRQDVEDAATVQAGLEGDRLRVDVEGPVRLGSMGMTTLFRPVGSLTQHGSVRLRPNRCDAHALADDKQGTFFPLEVTLADGRTGTYRLGVDEPTRAALYGLYARMCGL